MLENIVGSVKRELQASLEFKLTEVGYILTNYKCTLRNSSMPYSLDVILWKGEDNNDIVVPVIFEVDSRARDVECLYLSISGSSLDNAKYFHHADLTLTPKTRYRRSVDIISRRRNWDELEFCQVKTRCSSSLPFLRRQSRRLRTRLSLTKFIGSH
ncbi:hypothetical protein OBBRIDRAFT_428528 [Obba rivulosa]|uniref:Uncharacterized protein n=1 Tax=Obba rivulosa TaxID=1052685 RepID=A0A8E2B5Q4_9APHY|nr:hypothetical protein OBBRIDRAFT_428528 [Obba rivulosa]